MEVNEKEIGELFDVNDILCKILENYYGVGEFDDSVRIGKNALISLAALLEDSSKKEDILLDEFIFELFASRHTLLKKICADIRIY